MTVAHAAIITSHTKVHYSSAVYCNTSQAERIELLCARCKGWPEYLRLRCWRTSGSFDCSDVRLQNVRSLHLLTPSKNALQYEWLPALS